MKKVTTFRLRELMQLHAKKTGQPCTQRSVAAGAGLTPRTINLVVNNKNERVFLDTLDKLCNYFDCDLSDLMRRVSVVEATIPP